MPVGSFNGFGVSRRELGVDETGCDCEFKSGLESDAPNETMGDTPGEGCLCFSGVLYTGVVSSSVSSSSHTLSISPSLSSSAMLILCVSSNSRMLSVSSPLHSDAVCVCSESFASIMRVGGNSFCSPLPSDAVCVCSESSVSMMRVEGISVSAWDRESLTFMSVTSRDNRSSQ